MAIGDHKDCDQSFLCVDKKILMEVPTEDIMFYLVAVYYVFNICYPYGKLITFTVLWRQLSLGCLNHLSLLLSLYVVL